MTCRFCLAKDSESPVTDLLLSPSVSKPLVECRACGSYYFSPRPNAEEISTCYVGDYRHDFFRTHRKNIGRGAKLAKRFARGKERGRFLDVGCSIGSMLEGFRAASGWDVSGTEFDAECVEHCRAKGLDVVRGLLYEVKDEYGWTGAFDVVLANNVLEHDPDPRLFLEKVHTLLKPGGVLLLNIPNGRVDAYPSIRLRALGHPEVTTNNEGHINFFSRAGIEALLRSTGFATESFESFHVKMALKKRFLLPGSTRKNRKTCIDRLKRTPAPHQELAVLAARAPYADLKLPSRTLNHRFPRLPKLPLPVFPLANDFRIVCRRAP